MTVKIEAFRITDPEGDPKENFGENGSEAFVHALPSVMCVCFFFFEYSGEKLGAQSVGFRAAFA